MEPIMIKVLCILALMVVGLLTHVLPYGVTGMICCVLFVITGVCDIPTAFSGLANSTTILVACMIVVATQLGRTSFVGTLKNIMQKYSKKQGIVVLLVFIGVTILLAQLMGQIACLSLLLMFCQSLEEDGDYSSARVFFAIGTINTIWTSKLPFGMGATMSGTINSFYQGLVTSETQLCGIADYFKAGIIPCVLAVVYTVVFFKLIPKDSKLDSSSAAAVKEAEKISKKDEAIIWIVFALVTLGFMFQNRLGANVTNIIPAAAVLVFIVTKVLKPQEAVKTLTGDLVWMVASMTAMSTILGKSGVGDLIGKTVLNILGQNPSELTVIIVFCVASALLTTVLNNLGTMGVMIPIAASTALAGGMNVRPVVLTVAVASWFAFLLPTASPGALMTFGMSKVNLGKSLRFTIPLLVVCMVGLVIGVRLFFPVFG